MASPRRALETLRSKVADGWPAGLTLLHGDDRFHLDAAQQLLLDALVDEQADEFGLSIYGTEKVDVGTVVAAVRSVGMFAPRRVVLVRDVAALDGEPDGIVAFAESPPPDCYLIVRAESLDKRRKLHKALLASARVIAFEAVDSPRALAGLAPDVTAMAKEKGVTLGRGVGALLVEACTGDFYRIDAELEKLRAWLGDEAASTTVTPAALRELASDGGLVSGFEIAEAVLQRDRGAALDAVRRLTDGGAPPIQLLGGLAWRCRGMVQAKAALAAGRRGNQLAAVAGGPHRVRALVDGVERYTMDELIRFPSYLLDADRTLKSRAIEPRAVLERTVERMIGGDEG